jgi:hypothetical protein
VDGDAARRGAGTSPTTLLFALLLSRSPTLFRGSDASEERRHAASEATDAVRRELRSGEEEFWRPEADARAAGTAGKDDDAARARARSRRETP